MVILTFLSIHHALAAESILRECIIPYELLPTPRAITAHCGLSLSMAVEDFKRVQALLEGAGIAIVSVHTKENEDTDYKLLVTKE